MTSKTIPWPSLQRGLVAILRGIKPAETEATVVALADTGFEAIEIPLNSPDPFESIEIAVKAIGDRCLVGAGTVLTPTDVDRLVAVGGRLMVSPNTDPAVIRHASGAGLVTMPGVFTATEALAAVAAGASALKFFPANVLGPTGITAIRAVLPPGIEIGAVGGVSNTAFADYAAAGIRSFGLGSSLYKPGASAEVVAEKARAAVAAYDRAFAATAVA